MISYVCFPVTKELRWKFKQKCNFYDVPEKEVFTELMIKFLAGEFDEYFRLPVDKETE